MTFLLIDTGAPTAVVGVCTAPPSEVRAGVDVEVRGEVLLTELRRHAEALPEAVAQALAQASLSFADLRGVAVGVGPGSFIGVRVGIAYAKGLCLALGVPLVGLSSLQALLCDAEEQLGGVDGSGAVVIDAKRGEVFVQHARRSEGRCVLVGDPGALAPAAAAEALADARFLVGSGAHLLALGGPRRLDADGPRAVGLARALAARAAQGPLPDETSSLVPTYARAPDAKLPAR
jgi:tRNA threonylcarbamoyladenosine biosynthesis protein TsaB